MFSLPVPILHSYICERFIYFQDRSAYSAAGKYVDRFWEYINPLQTEKEYISGIFLAVYCRDPGYSSFPDSSVSLHNPYSSRDPRHLDALITHWDTWNLDGHQCCQFFQDNPARPAQKIAPLSKQHNIFLWFYQKR
jgi:hypothetical protein